MDKEHLPPAELLERGVEFAQEALQDAGSKLYIHCAAGVHRAGDAVLTRGGHRGGGEGGEVNPRRAGGVVGLPKQLERRCPVRALAIRSVRVACVIHFFSGYLNYESATETG